jgi:hypothetical protein
LDTETKTLMLSMCKTLLDIAESAFQAEQMSLLAFVALQSEACLADAHQAHNGITLEQIRHLRHSVLERLDGEIERLQSPV